jgi:hypothetical protein
LIQALAFKRDQANGEICRVELENDWRKRSWWKAPEVRHCKVRNITYGRIGICSRLKVDLDEADASERPGFNMIDPTSKSEEAFVTVRDVGFDLLWRHIRVKRSHYDHGNVDLRKEVDRHASNCGRTNNDDEQAHHQNEERILDCERRHYWLSP